MRYFFVLAVVLVLAGCGDSNIELNGTVTGANTGSVFIRDDAKEIIYKADIVDGKFHINKQALGRPGFYKIDFSAHGKTSPKHDIYLERGSSYIIEVDGNNLNVYPRVTGTSKKQNELSAYYDLVTATKAASRAKVMALDSQMRDLGDLALEPSEHSIRLQELRNQQLDANVPDMASVFNTFIKQHPDSEITPYLMLNAGYETDPVGYYEAYKNLSDDAKDTPEGKQLEEKLKQLVGLAAGGEAPPIEGTTPEGKKIDLKKLNKKIILLDFWKARNSQSEGDHAKMQNELLPTYGSKGLGIVSLSFDDNHDQWTSYIAKSKMTWPQVSDLKGNDSPNVEHWAITQIPTYYLLDGNGRIIKRCLDYYEVETGIIDYMAKHP